MTDQTIPTQGAGAPIEIEGDDGFEANFKEFMGHSLDDEDLNEDQPGGEDNAAPADGEIPPAPPPVDPNAAPSAEPAPAADPNVAPATGTPPVAAPAEAAPVDPKLLAQILGIGDQPVVPQAQPQAAPAPQPSAAPVADDGPWTPLPTNFKLPPAISQALFESDDTATREQAFTTVLSSMGNVVAQLVEQRLLEVHAPAFRQQLSQEAQQAAEARAVYEDFYGTFQDLQGYAPLVVKCFQAVQLQNAGKPYSEEIRNQVGNLARQAIKQLNLAPAAVGATPAPQAPGAPQVVAPRKNAAPPQFHAGASRPNGQSPQGDDPGSLLDQLGGF